MRLYDTHRDLQIPLHIKNITSTFCASDKKIQLNNIAYQRFVTSKSALKNILIEFTFNVPNSSLGCIILN